MVGWGSVSTGALAAARDVSEHRITFGDLSDALIQSAGPGLRGNDPENAALFIHRFAGVVDAHEACAQRRFLATRRRELVELDPNHGLLLRLQCLLRFFDLAVYDRARGDGNP